MQLAYQTEFEPRTAEPEHNYKRERMLKPDGHEVWLFINMTARAAPELDGISPYYTHTVFCQSLAKPRSVTLT
jgi:hypothetical protein